LATQLLQICVISNGQIHRMLGLSLDSEATKASFNLQMFGLD